MADNNQNEVEDEVAAYIAFSYQDSNESDSYEESDEVDNDQNEVDSDEESDEVDNDQNEVEDEVAADIASLQIASLDESDKEIKEIGFDWMDYGIFNPIREQVMDTCTAFSVAQCIEAIYCLKKGERIILSPAYLVEKLADKDGAASLKEILMHVKYVGIPYEADYPLYSRNIRRESNLLKIANFNCINGKKVDQIVDEVQKQPLVGVFQLHDQFKSFYREDIDIGPAAFHAMILTGWREVDGKRFWRVRNSWDPKLFGENGCVDIPVGYNEVATLTECHVLLV